MNTVYKRTFPTFHPDQHPPESYISRAESSVGVMYRSRGPNARSNPGGGWIQKNKKRYNLIPGSSRSSDSFDWGIFLGSLVDHFQRSFFRNHFQRSFLRFFFHRRLSARRDKNVLFLRRYKYFRVQVIVVVILIFTKQLKQDIPGTKNNAGLQVGYECRTCPVHRSQHNY